jgi:hypothetical protein
LEPSTSFGGTAFAGFVQADSGPHGSRRTTLIEPDFNSADVTATSIRNLDVITDVTGTYIGAKRLSQFTLSQYEIQFHDYVNSRVEMITQKRFSFLPQILSQKSFFPLLVADKTLSHATGETREPAIFTPGDYLFSKATQVISPRFDSKGQLEALQRPALFHLESQEGCSALPTAKPADSNGPSELVFFCGDHFTSVPLSY